MPPKHAPGMKGLRRIRPLSDGNGSWSNLGLVQAWSVPAGCPVKS